MVQRGYGSIGGGLPHVICYLVKPELRGFRGAQCGRFGRAHWSTCGLEDQSGADARYMKSYNLRLFSVSRAAMGLPKTPAPGVQIEDESAGVPPVMAEDDLPPDVIGVPPGAFAWS